VTNATARFRPLYAGGVLAARELLPQTGELSSGTRIANAVARLALRAVVPRRAARGGEREAVRARSFAPRRAARHGRGEDVRPRQFVSARSARAGLSQRDKHHHISFQRENCYRKRVNFPSGTRDRQRVERLALRAVVPVSIRAGQQSLAPGKVKHDNCDRLRMHRSLR